MRPLRALAALLFAAVTLTGCMKIEMDLTVSKSDTINGSMIFAMEKVLLTASGQSPEKAFEQMSSGNDSLPTGSRVEVYDDGKFYGQRILFENLALAEFNKSSDKEADAPRLVHENGRYVFTMKAKAASDELGAEGAQMAAMLANVEMKFTVTFPGKVIEHDADAKVDGNTATWNLRMTKNYELRAVAEEPALISWQLATIVGSVLCVVLVAVLIVVAVVISRRRRTPPAAVTQEGVVVPGPLPPTAAYPTIDDRPAP
ncbi:LppM family (lipo)protein [Catelliglobosispora koreensis]|uniref:LppM family (lipo)protein n=1 Tax=Catelliglobosispora koreensis TaxID=129052 RepID=UPI00035C7C64|nr:hypothetical protein [Catelliglobosispora koreensis]